ncbi:MAG: hypothetical protein M3N32_02715 [Actinomycetota bacterium]|nr:hypothetical protein [Actinomycetota bacterium]
MTLTRIHVGAPINRGALTLFPLWTEHPEVDGEYISGSAAEAAKVLTIGEMQQATVPQLLAHNSGASPVLLVEGEVLAGGLQTRVLNLSVLLPPVQSLSVPVACLEAGRWHNRRRSRRGGTHSPPTLRRHKTASVNRAKAHGQRLADQAAVWASVSDYEQRLAAPSATSSYADVVDHRKADVDSITQGLQPLPGQRGVVVGIGGTVRGLELFDRAATFADYFDSLLAGFAVEALSAEPVATPAAEARRFVRQLAKANWSWGDAVGLGQEVTVEGDHLTGSGLGWSADRPPVHLAAFA